MVKEKINKTKNHLLEEVNEIENEWAKKHQNVCMPLNYVNKLIILDSAATGRSSIIFCFINFLYCFMKCISWSRTLYNSCNH